MDAFGQYFLMKPADVKRYAVEVLHFFPSEEGLTCAEIGDGNINYVFRVVRESDGRSVIVKQSDRLLRSSGRPLDPRRSKIEAQLLTLERQLAPDFIPEVYRYDETMSATSMEDISAYRNLRRELAAGRVYPHLSETLSTFLADVLLPTTDLVLDRQEKKRRVQFFTNPELCDITEDLVLTEPYDDYKGRNVITAGNEAFVEQRLYRDDALKTEVAKLRDGFMNHAQALLHGDLHSGSIFVNEQGVKVIDPEFAFYGPIGYDIGNVLGNLFFAWANKAFTAPEDAALSASLEKLIRELYDKTAAKLSAKYDALVSFPLYRTKDFKADYLHGVLADSLGYAGTEIIRRVVGDSKVAEVTSVTDPAQRIPMERALMTLGIALIKKRQDLGSGMELTEIFRRILA
jgi:5-methylthioribose kinase